MCNPPTTADAAYIEADDDSTSGYESAGADSSTQSLASSLNKYLEENGRRYHAYYGADKNFNPTDNVEKDRLDLQHEVFRLLADEKLYKAPVENPQRVLDLGTGTGIWCIDFADENPQAEVTGVDLSPIQPAWMPPNCKFELDDLEQDWTYPMDAYDFIHSRNVLNSIADAPKYFRQALDCLAPGGYIEIAEIEGRMYSDDDSLPKDFPTVVATELGIKAAEMIGRPFRKAEQLTQLLDEAGFEDIVLLPLKLPSGPWAKDKALRQAGGLQLLGLETLFHSYGLALFTRVLGMSEEEAQRICDDARDAAMVRARKEKVHEYTFFNIIYARKPAEK